MNRTINYNISKEYEGRKIHEFFSDNGYSAAILTLLRKDINLTLLNGTPAFLNSILKSGDSVTVTIPEEKQSEKIPAINLPFNVIYEDEDIVVINKPANMPIHPSLNNYENSLGNAAAYYYRNEDSPFVYRCINRLDRDTTGLTIIAKNLLSGSILANEKYRKSIVRTYYAIVRSEGLPDSGTINKPIGRKDGSTIERCIDYNNGETAITNFQVVDKFGKYALVECRLETGRTHQIRVHMASIGHPLVGDFLYNPDDTSMSRQALHAGKLTFIHPINKEQLSFSLPLPEDMLLLIDRDI